MTTPDSDAFFDAAIFRQHGPGIYYIEGAYRPPLTDNGKDAAKLKEVAQAALAEVDCAVSTEVFDETWVQTSNDGHQRFQLDIQARLSQAAIDAVLLALATQHSETCNSEATVTLTDGEEITIRNGNMVIPPESE